MEMYLNYKNELGINVDVEIKERNRFDCVAYYFDSNGDCWEYEFDLRDVPAEWSGCVEYAGEFMTICYNPYSEGFEYIREEVINFLYYRHEKFVLCQ